VITSLQLGQGKLTVPSSLTVFIPVVMHVFAMWLVC